MSSTDTAVPCWDLFVVLALASAPGPSVLTAPLKSSDPRCQDTNLQAPAMAVT